MKRNIEYNDDRIECSNNKIKIQKVVLFIISCNKTRKKWKKERG